LAQNRPKSDAGNRGKSGKRVPVTF
jgi:hypothetical protein